MSYKLAVLICSVMQLLVFALGLFMIYVLYHAIQVNAPIGVLLALSFAVIACIAGLVASAKPFRALLSMSMRTSDY